MLIRNPLCQVMLLGAVVFCLNQSVMAESKPVHWTPEKIIEFTDLHFKENLTSGFFDCMAATQNANPNANAKEKCIPSELKFQNHVLEQNVTEYAKQLDKTLQDDLEKVQKSFTDYRIQRCDWYSNRKAIANPKKPIQDPKVAKLTCLLSETMSRRLELENLIASSDN